MSVYVVGSSKNRFLPLKSPRIRFLVDEPHSGFNADFLNPWWCELTGLFYMWVHQNETDDEFYGIEHYRRYFSTDNGVVLNETDIKERLAGYDIIMYTNPNSCAYNDMTVTGKRAEMDLACRIALEMFGRDFGTYFADRIRKKNTCEGNMFITSRYVLNWYCKSLFNFLNQFDKLHNFRTPRITGYIAEYFMGPWMEFNQLRIRWNSRVAYDKNLTTPTVLRCY